MVDRSGQPIIELVHNMTGNCFVQAIAGEWIPLQSSIVNAQFFFSNGGFNPLLAGPEDIDLLRKITLRGDLDTTSAKVACIGMGVEESSTDNNQSVLDSRIAREKVLDEPGVLSRLHGSADSSYWRGRVVRAYLTSMIWNLQERRFFTAASRSLYGLFSSAMAFPNLISKDYWIPITLSHESKAFLQGFQKIDSPVERREIG